MFVITETVGSLILNRSHILERAAMDCKYNITRFGKGQKRKEAKHSQRIYCIQLYNFELCKVITTVSGYEFVSLHITVSRLRDAPQETIVQNFKAVTIHSESHINCSSQIFWILLDKV